MLGNIGTGRKVVTTHGTRVPLAATAGTIAARLIITALKSNTNLVAVGGVAVVAAAGTEQGVLLKATDQPLELSGVDLSRVYIDSITDGEGVSYAYEY
jgi:hypothetical protein